MKYRGVDQQFLGISESQNSEYNLDDIEFNGIYDWTNIDIINILLVNYILSKFFINSKTYLKNKTDWK